MKYFSFLIFSLILLGCERDDLSIPPNSVEQIEAVMSQNKDLNSEKAGGGLITVTCPGNCDDSGSECPMTGSMKDNTVACGCSGCTMRIEYEGVQVPNDQIAGHMQGLNEWVIFTMQKALQKYVELDAKISKISLEKSYGAAVVVYNLSLDNGSTESIMYTYSASEPTKARANGDTYEVDCTGTCDCREQFNFNTNTASCSCDECKMNITKVDKAPNIDPEYLDEDVVY